MHPMKLEAFAEHVDSTFHLQFEDTSTLDVLLVEAVPQKPTAKGFGVPDTIRDDPFALLFRGPGDKPLPQRIYSITHDKMGELTLFLVPVGIDEHGRYYEALFN